MPYNAAEIHGGKAVNRTPEPRRSPKEAVAILADFGVTICEETLRYRCNLPASHPLHIRRAPGFLGRYYIPESELFRLLGISEGAV